MTRLTLYVCPLFLFLLVISCKKESVTEKKVNVSYYYNGKIYNEGLGFYVGNILINVPEEPGSFIYINSQQQCAFKIPAGLSYYTSYPGCNVSFDSPVDSSQLYFYRSGTMNYSYYDCYNFPVMVYGSGGVRYVEHCKVTGSFDLMLSNNKNDIITVKSNGDFVIHDISR